MKSKIKQNQFFIILSAVVFILIIAFLAVNGFNPSRKKSIETNANGASKTATKSQSGEAFEQASQITIVAAGDDLMNNSLVNAHTLLDGNYDFSPLFSAIKADIENADLAIVNQESLPGVYETDATYNAPFEIGDALSDVGFDVVLHATNHAACGGQDAILKTLNFWEKYPQIKVLGLHKSQADADNVTVVEKNGIKVAMLNYTYGVNDTSLNKDYPYYIDLLDEERVKSDTEKARQKADVVMVFVHWGTDYSDKKDAEQDKWTSLFYQCGVDIVIGSHPHVLQPVEWVTSGENNHNMLVYYSLGNLVSGSTDANRLLGALAKITIKKSSSGIEITSATALPIFTHYDEDIKNYAVYSLWDYNDELAQKHYVNSLEQKFNYDQLIYRADTTLGDFIEK